MKAYFFISALHAGKWSASRPGRFIRRERVPRTHWIGGWVGLRAGPDAMVKRKVPSPCRDSKFMSGEWGRCKVFTGIKAVRVSSGTESPQSIARVTFESQPVSALSPPPLDRMPDRPQAWAFFTFCVEPRLGQCCKNGLIYRMRQRNGRL
jgi:hypothetical protein